LAERYGHHASFGGVAVHMGGESYALLPDETCSYDEETIARFANETGTALPEAGASASPMEVLSGRAEFLHGEGKLAWLKWRSEQVTGMYLTMQRELVQRRASAKLYLPTADLLTGPRVRLALRPTLPTRDDPAALLSAMGLDIPRLVSEGIIIPRPQRIIPASSPSSQELERHWNAHSGLDALFAGGGRGTGLHFFEPAPLRLPDFDAASPFGADKTRTLLISQIAPAGAAQRERFVRSLAALDAPLMIDGGWLLPLGQEAALGPLAQVFRRLPSEPFATAQPASISSGNQEVLVRTLVKNGKTYFYAVNPLPWPHSLQIIFQTPQPAPLMTYAERKAEVQQQEGRTSWKIALEPFDLVGGEIASGQAKVVDWVATPPAEAKEVLKRRIQEARLRANAIRRQPLAALTAVPNASFEAPAQEVTIPNWVAARGQGIVAEVERREGHLSPSSLHLVSQANPMGQAPIVWIRSEPIRPRATGRLRLVAFIRVADAAKQPKLRLAIEGKFDGQVYYRRANVGMRERAADPPATPLTTKWAAYHFPLDDLPISGLTDLRVGFDLMGEGEVWIDEVQVYDVWLEPHEHEELLWSFVTADLRLSEGHLGECHEFVESYWPSFLRRHVPLGDLKAAQPLVNGIPQPPIPSPNVAARPAPPAESSPDPPESEPSRWQRLRGWVPSWPKWR
jgi:hypothetical protein